MDKRHGTTVRKAIERLLEESSICERWMTTKVYTVGPSDTIAHARELLRQHRINQLPVVAGDKLLGIVSDRDVRDTAILDDISVQTIMKHPPITLSCHSSLVNAAEVMRQNRIGSVPIVSAHSLVGIVTRSDLLEAFVAYACDRYKRLDGGHEKP
jgi:acetoin utilization protein AcuB